MPQNRNLREGVNIRLPDGMRDRIRRNAAANHRSMNSEIVHYLDRALAADQEKAPEGARFPHRTPTDAQNYNTDGDAADV